jgi:pimeloyl-ACP methyl ester carboxylesterase
VPLDHAGRRSGRLRLRVAVERGKRPNGPLLVLAGGPGQAGIPFAAEVRRRLGDAADGFRLVVLDQRGTGAGALRCTALQRAVGASDLAVAPPGAVEACARRLDERRDLSRTADSVGDLERLRRALGAERWTIAGISYGTYVAQRYALRHPDRVDGLVLDSVVPQDGVDILQRRNLAATSRVLRAVCAEQECEGDPVADLERVVAVSPDGAVELFDAMVGLSIGVPRLEEVPAALREAAAGRPARLEGLIAGVRENSDAPVEVFSAGLHAATLCAESRAPWRGPQAPPADREQALAVARERLRGADLGGFDARTATRNGLADTCRRWPPQEPPPAAGDVRLPGAPVLLLAGQLDLSTPLEDARAQAARIPRRRLVELPGMGHSTLLADPTGCAAGALSRFLDRRPIGRCTRAPEPAGAAVP